jgi:hypothetical protein
MAYRLPFSKIVSCSSAGPKELHLKTTFCTTCKQHNLDKPYIHRHLNKEVSVLIELEFASMDSLMMQLMQVLEISKTASIIERESLLQARSTTRNYSCSDQACIAICLFPPLLS